MRRNLFHCSNSQQGATDKVTLLFGITGFFQIPAIRFHLEHTHHIRFILYHRILCNQNNSHPRTSRPL